MHHPWDKEYQSSRFITKSNEPTKAFLRFAKFMRKKMGGFDHTTVLDVGCGTGRHSKACAQRGAQKIIGLDISIEAIRIAQKENAFPSIVYKQYDIAKKLPIDDSSIDIALDLTSSCALSPSEFEYYIEELRRVLKPGGIICLRSLKLDGDNNAKKLLRDYPGAEKGTYVLPESNLTERPDSREYIEKVFKEGWKTLSLTSHSGYSTHGTQKYKRHYWEGWIKQIAKNPNAHI